MTKRLLCGTLCALLLFAALLPALPPARAAGAGPLTGDALAEMEADAAADPLSADFEALWAGLSALAEREADDGWRVGHPQEAAGFDALAARRTRSASRRRARSAPAMRRITTSQPIWTAPPSGWPAHCGSWPGWTRPRPTGQRL